MSAFRLDSEDSIFYTFCHCHRDMAHCDLSLTWPTFLHICALCDNGFLCRYDLPQIYLPMNMCANAPGKTQGLAIAPFTVKQDVASPDMAPIVVKLPEGTKIARWYCPDGHSTFSLLPDCLSSRLPGSLIDVETAINEVENAPSQEAAVFGLRIDVGLTGVLRWIRRRLFLIHTTLRLLTKLVPALKDCRPSISSFKAALGVEYVLPALRMSAGPYLYVLPPPVGFGPRPQRKKGKKPPFQHKTGTDPPLKRE